MIEVKHSLYSKLTQTTVHIGSVFLFFFSSHLDIGICAHRQSPTHSNIFMVQIRGTRLIFTELRRTETPSAGIGARTLVLKESHSKLATWTLVATTDSLTLNCNNLYEYHKLINHKFNIVLSSSQVSRNINPGLFKVLIYHYSICKSLRTANSPTVVHDEDSLRGCVARSWCVLDNVA